MDAAHRIRAWFGAWALFCVAEVDSFVLPENQDEFCRILGDAGRDLTKVGKNCESRPEVYVIPYTPQLHKRPEGLSQAVAACLRRRRNVAVACGVDERAEVDRVLSEFSGLARNLSDSVIVLSDTVCCSGRELGLAGAVSKGEAVVEVEEAGAASAGGGAGAEADGCIYGTFRLRAPMVEWGAVSVGSSVRSRSSSAAEDGGVESVREGGAMARIGSGESARTNRCGRKLLPESVDEDSRTADFVVQDVGACQHASDDEGGPSHE